MRFDPISYGVMAFLIFRLPIAGIVDGVIPHWTGDISKGNSGLIINLLNIAVGIIAYFIRKHDSKPN